MPVLFSQFNRDGKITENTRTLTQLAGWIEPGLLRDSSRYLSRFGKYLNAS